MLKGQRAYGGAPSIASSGPITFGRSLHALLPEDAFDNGVLTRGANWLVADVRLDNRLELARALGIDIKAERQLSDAALLFECLLKWNEAALPRLAGEFAFAWWDAARRELRLGRDMMGMRPLYFHSAVRWFAFASMPSGLHALPEVPQAFDAEFMAESLALLPWHGSRTWLEGIQRVEPGHLVRIKGGTTTSSRYWHPPASTAAGTGQDYEEGLRAVIDEAVRAQLRGAGDAIGSHLSSGLDSSTITATAAREFFPGKVIAFTAVPRRGYDGPVPKGTFADESTLASLTAALHPNIEHVPVDTSTDPLLEPLDAEFHFQQQPIVNICNAKWSRAINRMAHDRGLKVVLTGNAGNMSITYGGLEWISQLLDGGQVLRAAGLSRRLAANGVPWTAIAGQIAGPLVPTSLWNLAQRLRGRPTGIGEIGAVDMKRLRELDQGARDRKMDLAFRPSRNSAERRLWSLSRDDGGNYYKGVLAQWGVSLRDPTADKRVIEYCLQLPASEFVRGGVRRSVAKRAFADRLPAAVIDEPLRGHQSADWHESVERELPQLKEEIERIERCPGVDDVMALDWLRDAAATWPSGGWARDEIERRYRWGLLRAVSAGHFMRKVARSN